jgi:hypothetical protein
VRSGPGAARTILLFHIISARPSKQPRMVRTFLKVYMELVSYFLFLQEQIKDIIIIRTRSDKDEDAEVVQRASKKVWGIGKLMKTCVSSARRVRSIIRRMKSEPLNAWTMLLLRKKPKPQSFHQGQQSFVSMWSTRF